MQCRVQPPVASCPARQCLCDPGDALCMQAVKPDLSNFDGATSAWPLLIDEFVDHIRERGPKQIDVSEH